MRFDRSSRRRLTPETARLFTADTLFDRVARTVCEAGCLPRKELFEAWEVAKRVRRHFRGDTIVDACAGHGLLAYLFLLLDDTSPRAICVDSKKPKSAETIAGVLERQWPRLAGRVVYRTCKLQHAELDQLEGPVLVASVHACGTLTDDVIDIALAQRARIAVMPCCHALGRSDDGALSGWLPGPLAVDVMRAGRLRDAGYHVRTKTIPADVTPQNRLLMGDPQTKNGPVIS